MVPNLVIPPLILTCHVLARFFQHPLWDNSFEPFSYTIPQFTQYAIKHTRKVPMVGGIRHVVKLEKMIPPAYRTSIGPCFPLSVTGKVKAMLARQLCHKFGCGYHRLANGAKRTGGWSDGLDAQHGLTTNPKKTALLKRRCSTHLPDPAPPQSRNPRKVGPCPVDRL